MPTRTLSGGEFADDDRDAAAETWKAELGEEGFQEVKEALGAAAISPSGANVMRPIGRLRPLQLPQDLLGPHPGESLN